MSSHGKNHKSMDARALQFQSFPGSPAQGVIKEVTCVETAPRTHRASSTANVEIHFDFPKSLGVSKRSKHRTWGKNASSSLAQLLERAWNWIFVILLFASLALSAIALTQDDERWLKSDSSDEARVGWRAACIDQEDATNAARIIVPCRPGDSTQLIDDIVTPRAGRVGTAILIVSIASWLFPLALMTGAFCLDCRRRRVCHGWTIALLWGVAGICLVGLVFWFRWIVNDHLSDLDAVKLSVTCSSEIDGEVAICDEVDSLDQCAAQCRTIESGDVICVGYSDCALSERSATCDLDGVGCEMSMGCAMYASLGSSALMILLAVVQALGSWRLAKDL